MNGAAQSNLMPALLVLAGVIISSLVTILHVYVQHQFQSKREREEWIREQRNEHIAKIRQVLAFITALPVVQFTDEEVKKAYEQRKFMRLAKMVEEIYTAQSSLKDSKLRQMVEELVDLNYLEKRIEFGQLRDKIYDRLNELEADC